jgi:Glycosyl hydrolase 2 galactose-binding domain-like/Glycosyl hydrolases family 2/Glycosyl hydrolases family 2, TIM barrel domain
MKYLFAPLSSFRKLLFVLLGLLFWAGLFRMAHANGQVAMPADIPGNWSLIGRTTVQTNATSVILAGGFIVNQQVWTNAEITLRARVPRSTEQVQIWGGFRDRDRDSRYVFALRGGHDNDLYLARFAPDGEARFLGIAPLDFKPKPGVWYRLRLVILGNRFQIFLNDEKLPRINAMDRDPLWDKGGVLLGGGWLPAEFSDLQVKPLTAADEAAFLAIGNKRWSAPPIDKKALRERQRAEYIPAKISVLNPLRTKVSLDGNWLFMPDYQLAGGQKPIQLDYNDRNWHVMQVPSFWTPGLSWLYGETGFPDLDKFSATKGVAESLYVQRIKRCDDYTFDWRKTSAAWYRDYLDLPPDLGDRHFELTFDAIAKVSEIWVNGTEVGTHTGMFGRVKCDITKAVKPGRNVIAVHVVSRPNSTRQSANKVEGVAVTVEVTSAMLHSLPHGMFQDDVGGIWQPVKLTVTAPVLVSGCFIEPGLHGADINLDILNSRRQPEQLEVGYSIISAQDGTLLYSNPMARHFLAEADETGHLKLTTPYLNPKLWSPQDPNLYYLEIHLKSKNRAIDNYKVRFGFRTFTVDGNKFLLNGHPYWLRGADPFPNNLCPNDAVLARRFMKIAHDGNVRVTRTHIVPFTSTWLNAADEAGVAVSYEGTWPWLMIQGEPPSEQLLKIWKDEYLSLIREYRNHPGIILWTVNNEMNFASFDQNDPELLKKKWVILNDMIKAIRQTDPTRPVVAYSGYTRKEAAKGYHEVVRPNDFDDGDVDDIHRYYGWYNESFFHYYDGQFKNFVTPGRPLISQEMSTGYPNNDDGHPTRFYLFKHYTPQALVGDYAYENADPAIFLKRQAFMTKELAETLRRTSHNTAAGILFFSYVTWFQSPWLANQIKPWPAYYALKTALQPVLVSAELYGRHFYSGRVFHEKVCVINDAENYQAIPASRLIWEFTDAGKVLSQGQVDVPPVDYYTNHWLDVEFKTLRTLPSPRVDGQLVLRLESNGHVLSKNKYDVAIATPEWANADLSKKPAFLLWNPGNHPVQSMSGIPVTDINSVATLNPTNILIVGNLDGAALTPKEARRLKTFVSQGGRVLMLHPEQTLADLFPDEIKAYKSKEGEIVTMHIPESPVFSGIEPLDMAWFDRGDRRLPIACSGVYQIVAGRQDTTALADQCDFHAYLKDPSEITRHSGTPLVEIRYGKGRLIASEMNFGSDKNDPVSRRILSNILDYLSVRGREQ